MNHKVFIFSFICLFSFSKASTLDLDGKLIVGPLYYNETDTVNEGLAIKPASGRLYFSSNYLGDPKPGIYFFYEADVFNNLNPKHFFLGAKSKKLNMRLGQIDSLVYHWVGKYSNPWEYAGNIAVVPRYNRYIYNSGRLVNHINDQIDIGVAFGLNGLDDYNYYDLGIQWSNDFITLATVYQTNSNDDTTSFSNRDTWGSAIVVNPNNHLSLMANHAHYTQSYANNSNKNAFSVGFSYDNAVVFYQTSQNKDQARINYMQTKNLSPSTKLGFETQIPVNNLYYDAGSQSKTKDTAFAGFFLRYVF